MLELLEELDPKARKVFNQHVHMNELTALSINGDRGQALVMTNRYLYLITRGFFKSSCRKVSPGELADVEVKGPSMEVKITGSPQPLTFRIPPEKTGLLPSIARRLLEWQRERSPEA